MRSQTLILAVFFLVATVAANCEAREPTSVVHFNSAVLPPASTESTESGKNGFPIWGHLTVPEGEGPFPAVILMHGCGGIQTSHGRWADLLVEAGYVTFILDSLGPRSLIRTCEGRGQNASPTARSLDAFGSLDFLSRQTFVDAQRIGIIGWSDGGIAALGAINQSGIGEKFGRKFAAAVAFYPFCISDRSFQLPLLILIGGADDWTPAHHCEDLRTYSLTKGRPIDLIVYPGVHHGFDEPELAGGLSLMGADGQRHLLRYDETAHRDSISKVIGFLDLYLVSD